MTVPDVPAIARVCHEANSAWQIATGDPAPSPHWDDAPQWQRDSAVIGVHEALRGVTPERLHQSWCDTKRATGWTFGPVKDDQALTHPCLIPYDTLPREQVAKDELFRAIVEVLAGV